MSINWKRKYEKSREDYESLEQWCNHVEANRHEAILELQYERGKVAGLEKALEILNRDRTRL